MFVSASAYAQAAAPTAALTWDNYSAGDIALFGVTGFEVDRAIVPIGTTCSNILVFTKIATVTLPQVSYTDTVTTLGMRNCYVVAGVYGGGKIGPQSISAGKDFPFVAPAAPTNLRVL